MSLDKNSVPYMTEYLKYALKFEKYVYIWSQALDEANARMRHVYNNRKQLMAAKKNVQNRLAVLEHSVEAEKQQHDKKSFGGMLFAKRKEAKHLEAQASFKRQETILQAQEAKVTNELTENNSEETALIELQDEIYEALLAAKNNLTQIYEEDVLPPKYRNLSAVATMLEYMMTRRCNAIDGYGGIFSTYAIEALQLEQLYQAVKMNQTLSRMEDNQRYMCCELKQANQTLSEIKEGIGRLEITSARIAENTAISASANQQTAETAQWLAWRAWANGY